MTETNAPDVWWSPTEGVLAGENAREYVWPDELPADAVRLVREEDVDDLRLRLWQEQDAARAAGIPRGSIVAAQSVVGNILMNAPESMSLQEIAVAIVDEVAGALAVLPGDAAAVPDTGQARAVRLADGIRRFADDCKLLLDFGGLDNRVARSIAQQERNLRALLDEPSGDTVQAPEVDNDAFGVTCIDCGEAVTDDRPSGETEEGPVHYGCGDTDPAPEAGQ